MNIHVYVETGLKQDYKFSKEILYNKFQPFIVKTIFMNN